MNKKNSLYLILFLFLMVPLMAYADDAPTLASQTWTNIKDAASSLFSGLDELVSFFLDFFTGGAMTIVAGISFFIMFLGKILMYIGLTFGPLLLAMAPFRLTRPLALKWGEFMFGAMMYTGVATVVVMLCTPMFLKLKEFQDGAAAASAAVGYVSPTIISMVSIMIAMMAAMIMWRVPSITAQLFGGIGLQAHAPKMLGKGSGSKGGDDKTHEKLDKIIEAIEKKG